MMLKQAFNLYAYAKSDSNMDSDDLNKSMQLRTQYSHETRIPVNIYTYTCESSGLFVSFAWQLWLVGVFLVLYFVHLFVFTKVDIIDICAIVSRM